MQIILCFFDAVEQFEKIVVARDTPGYHSRARLNACQDIAAFVSEARHCLPDGGKTFRSHEALLRLLQVCDIVDDCVETENFSIGFRKTGYVSPADMPGVAAREGNSELKRHLFARESLFYVLPE